MEQIEIIKNRTQHAEVNRQNCNHMYIIEQLNSKFKNLQIQLYFVFETISTYYMVILGKK